MQKVCLKKTTTEPFVSFTLIAENVTVLRLRIMRDKITQKRNIYIKNLENVYNRDIKK